MVECTVDEVVSTGGGVTGSATWYVNSQLSFIFNHWDAILITKNFCEEQFFEQ